MSDYWHFRDPDGVTRAYHLVDQQQVSYAQFERRRVDGRMVTVALPALEFSIATAIPADNETV